MSSSTSSSSTSSSTSTSVKKLPLPDGWGECPLVGQVIKPTPLIMFKSPYSPSLYDIPPEFMFTPKLLHKYEKSMGKRIGLWIGLELVEANEETTGQKNYDVKDLEEVQCIYAHVAVRRGDDPSAVNNTTTTTTNVTTSSSSSDGTTPLIARSSLEAFFSLVRRYSLSHPTDFIGVHDGLYGFNLSGFFVVSYLVEENGWDLVTAINAVADARPPGIYDPQLLQELYRLYNDEDASYEGGSRIPDFSFLPRPDWELATPKQGGLGIFDRSTLASLKLGTTQQSSALGTQTTTSANLNGVNSSETGGAATSSTIRRRKRALPSVPVLQPDNQTSTNTSSSTTTTTTTATNNNSNSITPTPTLTSVSTSAPTPAQSISPATDFNPVNKKPKTEEEEKTATEITTNVSSISPSTSSVSSSVSSSPASSSSSSSSSSLSADILKDHPYLIELPASSAFHSTITTLFPDAYDHLHFTPLSSDLFSTLSSSYRSSFSLSWLPRCQRCLLLIMREGGVMLSPAPGLLFQIPALAFVKRKALHEKINNCLLVGELVLDVTSDTPTPTPRFLITDTLVLSTTNLVSSGLTHSKRVQAADVELIQPLNQAKSQGMMREQSVLRCRVKQFFPSNSMSSVLKMKVPHQNLGITLQFSNTLNDPNAKMISHRIYWEKSQSSQVSEEKLLTLG